MGFCTSQPNCPRKGLGSCSGTAHGEMRISVIPSQPANHGFLHSPGETQHMFRGERILRSRGFSGHTHKWWNVASGFTEGCLVSSNDLPTLPSFLPHLSNMLPRTFPFFGGSHGESQLYKITCSGWSWRTVLSQITHSPGSC